MCMFNYFSFILKNIPLEINIFNLKFEKLYYKLYPSSYYSQINTKIITPMAS